MPPSSPVASGRDRFFRAIIRHRARVLAAGLGVLALAGAGASRVTVDYGVEQFFPSWGPERATYDEFKRVFPREDTQVSLFWRDARPVDEPLVRNLGRAATIFSDAGLQDVTWFGSVVAPDAAVPARFRDDARFDGFLWNADQTVFALHGWLPSERNTDAARRQVERALTDELRALEAPGRELVLTGIPIIRARVPGLLERDQTLLLGGGILLMLGLLLVIFRSPAQTALSVAAIIPAWIYTMGVMGLTGRAISILTAFIPIVVLVVGVCDTVHLLAGFRERAANGETVRDAVAHAFGDLAPACCYTSLTTAIGFAALAGTRIGIVVEFGLFTALAVVFTFAFTMTVLPALLSYLRPGRSAVRVRRPWMEALTRVVLGTARRPPGYVVAGAAILGIAALASARGLGVNTFLVDDFRPHSPLIEDLRWVEAQGFGVFQLNVLLRADDARRLEDGRTAAWMDELRGVMGRDSLVTATFTPAELPDLRVQAPGGMQAQVVATVRDAGSRALNPLIREVEGWLEAHPPPYGSAVLTGTVKLVQNFTDRLLQSFGPSLLLAMVLITAVMMHLFRSLRLGLLALIPNLLPLLVLLGILGAIGYALKPSTILVFSIAFGIIVDDTIHLLGRIRTLMRDGHDATHAVEAALQETIPALVITSIVVGAGFALLLFSQFEVLFLVGLLTASSVVAALAADLLLLPALLRLGWGHARAPVYAARRDLTRA